MRAIVEIFRSRASHELQRAIDDALATGTDEQRAALRQRLAQVLATANSNNTADQTSAAFPTQSLLSRQLPPLPMPVPPLPPLRQVVELPGAEPLPSPSTYRIPATSTVSTYSYTTTSGTYPIRTATNRLSYNTSTSRPSTSQRYY